MAKVRNLALAERLDRGQMFGLLAVLTGLLIPHALRFPGWLSALLATLFGWRLLLVQRQWRTPPAWLLLPIVFATIAGVFASYHTLLGRTGGVALLATLIAGKLLETRGRRDALFLIYLGYFLVVTNFLFDQSIALASYLFAMVLAITTLLISWHSLAGWDGRWRTLLAQARLALVLMLQALPIMLLLFVFFPRIEGPLWKLPQDRASAKSGLADSMSPGSFSNMAQSDEVAFRASFTDGLPAQDKLYWRGPVFEDYDGTTWTQQPIEPAAGPTVQAIGKPIRYTMTLEAHQRPWLLALDMPVQLPPDARLSNRLQLLGKPVDKRVRNELASVLDYRVGLVERPEVLARNQQLPASGNPKARALAQSWQNLPPRERINSALRLFRSQALNYTLQPPLYGADGIDQFIYVGKQGFCEHFAGAFVFMMRAAGLPARVVGGYQGGDLNGDYLIIRQADAHAWGEVWLAGEGWVRVDPTFEVAPERIERGLAGAVPQEELPYLLRLDDNLVKRVRLVLDAAVNSWNQWVVGYTPEKQRQVLRRLGIDDLASSSFVAWFGGALLLLGGTLAGWLLWQMRPPRRDPARREWDRFCAKFARYDLLPLPAEGPQDFASRAKLVAPAKAEQIEHIVQCYLRVRYGGLAELAQLRKAVRGFRHV
ncbi:DUF3488 and DUF4129 domain-containing transglutaminase family protein [Chitinimonas sp.]|uniref:transglutaminase TgpA family protein n=1 Tax=Chitinimonas sp. TaxID=1934313 RepID=UPI0035B0E654